MSHRELAPAPELVVEALDLEKLAAALLQAALAPVDVPVARAGREGRGLKRRLADLVEPLPAAPRERRREGFNAEPGGGAGRGEHAHAEADAAARAALGLALKPLDGLAPERVVVVPVDEGDAELAAVALALVLPHEVLLLRKDVGVEVKDRGRAVVSEEPFEDGARAGRAAAVQKNGRAHAGSLVRAGRGGPLRRRSPEGNPASLIPTAGAHPSELSRRPQERSRAPRRSARSCCARRRSASRARRARRATARSGSTGRPRRRAAGH